MRYVQEVNVYLIASYVLLFFLVLRTLAYVLISHVHLPHNNALLSPVLLNRPYAGMENVWISLPNVRPDHSVLLLTQPNVLMVPAFKT